VHGVPKHPEEFLRTWSADDQDANGRHLPLLRAGSRGPEGGDADKPKEVTAPYAMAWSGAGANRQSIGIARA
jgi:hypothetical protein